MANFSSPIFHDSTRFWLWLALVAALAAHADPINLLDRRVNVSIPAQKLPSALAALSRQAHVRIATSGQPIDSFTTRALEGRMSLHEALGALLAGTNLDFAEARYAKNTIDIIVDLNSYSSRPPELPQPPAFAGAPVLSEIQIVSQYENGYQASSSAAPTRTDTDILDIPLGISVMTRKLLDDQQAQTLADAVANASGVQLNSSQVVIGSTFVFRGFSLYTGGVLENGLSAPNAGYASTTPIWGLDSVEVLKGAGAILAGTNSSYGGLINLVLKQPQVTPIEAASFSYGTYGVANLSWDSAGALTHDQTLAYRLIAQITRSGGDAAGHDGGHYGYYLAPSLRWKTGDTSLLVGVERSVTDGPLPALALVPSGASPFASSNPIRVFGALDDAFHDYSTRPYFEFEQSLFGSPWTFRSRGQYKAEEVSINYWGFSNFSADAQGTGESGYYAELSDLHSRAYSLQNDIQGTFSTGSLTHQIVLGADYTYFSADYGYNGFVPTAPYNIYTSPPLPSAHDVVTPGPLLPVILNAEVGYLAMDQISWGPLRAQLAVRDALFHNYGVVPDTQHWVPDYGLLYRITPNFSAYANAMQGYTPRFGDLTGPGRLAPPQSATSYEIGVKADPGDRKLSVTADIFRIRVNETPYPDVANPLFVHLGPGQTSSGEEIELRGDLAPGLAVALAYTNMSAQDVGVPVQGVAHNTGNLWLAYQFQGSWFRHCSIGVGVNARSASLNQDIYSGSYYRNPGNASTDVHVGYTLDKLSFNLGVRDVFDRRIYDRYQMYSTSSVLDEVGTTMLLSAKFQFD